MCTLATATGRFDARRLHYAGLTPAGNGADETEDTLFQFLSLPTRSISLADAYRPGIRLGRCDAGNEDGEILLRLVDYAVDRLHNVAGRRVAIVRSDLENGPEHANLRDPIRRDRSNHDARPVAGDKRIRDDTAAITIALTGQSSVATAGLVTCNGFIVDAWN